MYEDILLGINGSSKESKNLDAIGNLDNLFDNLSSDIENVNRLITDVNQQKRVNNIEEKELLEERYRLNKDKIEFENYMKIQKDEFSAKQNQAIEYIKSQKEYLDRAEVEFKVNMDNVLNQYEIEKKELEMLREQQKEEKEQFETYKTLEINRIKQAEEVLQSEKRQFEKYKELNIQKIELREKTLEQKCEKFKEVVSKFNSSFKPMLEGNKE